jgi:hypothetical protein
VRPCRMDARVKLAHDKEIIMKIGKSCIL